MFDTMTMVKTVGALCGALLIFLLGNWAAEIVYHGGGGHGHGDGEHASGYNIEVAEGGAAEGEAEAEVPFSEILAMADIGKGEKVFRKCSGCHSLTAGENKSGPYLAGVVGRDAGTAEGFSYSGAFDGVVDVWDPDHLNGFLTKPGSYAPDTSMGFPGLKKVEDRANLIAYLQSVGG